MATNTSGSKQPHDSLSERELEVLSLLADGLSNKAIAQKLTLSLETIKWYNRQIYSKLNVSSRTQAVARARELDLLQSQWLFESRRTPAYWQRQSLNQLPSPSLDGVPQLPAFLAERPHETELRPLFVGRDRVLTRLLYFLTEALHGNGRVVFLDGDAGRGKTSLLTELTHHAQQAHPQLLTVAGACSAFAGVGDPYLPFRELMVLLSGDVEARLGAGAILYEQACRLWQAIPDTVTALLEAGPHLLDVFLSANGLLSRASMMDAHPAPWLVQLEDHVSHSHAPNLEQIAIFSEFTEFLHQLASQHPLLILLDDLHWADDASLGMLFHLVHRLAGSRILVVGTYRPEALADHHDRKRHPLKEIVAESQRIFGDIAIDLETKDRVESRTFVDALLDSEPNQLGQSFREAFFKHTAGHPLFSVELLREMRRRENLRRNEAGQWCEAESIDWQTIPARVEAVIGQRLSHLNKAERSLLEAASVEGETFTAEVIARVRHLDESRLVADISRDLVRQRRLLTAQGIEHLGSEGQHITRYRFQHHLFQVYLYQQLDENERCHLHEAVGVALEEVYGSQVEIVAAQLARHFLEANLLHKAITYFRLASQRATRLSAYQEAISGYQDALTLAHQLPTSAETRHLMFDLYIGLGEAQRRGGLFATCLDSFQMAAEAARALDSAEELAKAALAYEEARWRMNFPIEPSARLLKEALDKLGEEATVLRARVWINLARTLLPASSPAQVQVILQQALELAHQVNDSTALLEALYLTVRGDRRPALSAARLEMLNEMLELAQTLGSYELTRDIHGFLLLEYLERGDIEAFVVDEMRHAAPLAKRIKQPFYDHDTFMNQVVLAMLAGRFSEAEQLVQQSQENDRQMGLDEYDGIYSIQMFTIRREQGRLREMAPLVRLILNQNLSSAAWRPGLALLCAELDMRPEAQAEFEALAKNEFANVPRDGLWVTSLVYLVEVCAYLGDAKRAATLYNLLKEYDDQNVVVGHKTAYLGAAARYLGILATVLSEWHVAEGHFEKALVMDAKMGAYPWLAHTQCDYAAMLLARGNPSDGVRARRLLAAGLESAKTLSMRVLVERIEALQRAALV